MSGELTGVFAVEAPLCCFCLASAAAAREDGASNVPCTVYILSMQMTYDIKISKVLVFLLVYYHTLITLQIMPYGHYSIYCP